MGVPERSVIVIVPQAVVIGAGKKEFDAVPGSIPVGVAASVGLVASVFSRNLGASQVSAPLGDDVDDPQERVGPVNG